MQILSRSLCGGGVKGKGYEVWGGAPENLLSMGPERPCYAIVVQDISYGPWPLGPYGPAPVMI